MKIGEVPGPFIGEITEGIWSDPIEVEVNRKIIDESYDLILSPGQVVPHEVIGMANHSKNIFVGAGGVDKLIRKNGYCGRKRVLELVKDPACDDLRANMGAAAHLIHGSSDGRFTVTYAVQKSMCEQIDGVHFQSADVDEMMKRYDPAKLSYGYNTLPDGEEIFLVPNPALGLWIDKERFAREGGAL